MENVLLILLVGLLNLLSFYFGAKLSTNKEQFTINPMKAYGNHVEEKERKVAKQEYSEKQREMRINLDNIDNYDGTGLGQKNFE